MASIRRFDVLLAIFLVANMVFTGFVFHETGGLSDRVDTVGDDQDVIVRHLMGVDSTDTLDSSAFATRTGHLLAHDSSRDRGVIIEYRYQPLPVDGVYVNVSGMPVKMNTQRSIHDAQLAVENSAEYDPAGSGLSLTVRNTGDWEYLEGGSGGLSVARMVASTDSRYEVNESVVLTGVVEPDGDVKDVDYVTAKARIAEERGYDAIVIPKKYMPVNVNGIRVIQVTTLNEAMEYGLDPASPTNKSAT